MRGKRIVISTLILSFLLGVALIDTGKTSPALTFGCDPDVTVGINVGDPFALYLTAFDVTDLFLAEFTLSWDPAILTTTDAAITPGDTAPYLENILIKTVNAPEGWLKITVGRPIGVKTGLTGNVQCAKITFTVLAEGSCGLYLSDIRLKNVAGEDMTIERIIDGFFGSSGGHYAYACNETGALQNAFAEGETVYVVGGGFMVKVDYLDIYIVPNATWVDGQPIGSPVIPMVTVTTGWKGKAPYALSITALGVPPADYYDIVVDLEQNGIYGAATDGVDDVSQRPGFVGSGIPEVPEFPLGMMMPLALLPVLVYVLWTRKRKNINANWRR
jgi:hypothetical protein